MNTQGTQDQVEMTLYNLEPGNVFECRNRIYMVTDCDGSSGGSTRYCDLNTGHLVRLDDTQTVRYFPNAIVSLVR